MQSLLCLPLCGKELKKSNPCFHESPKDVTVFKRGRTLALLGLLTQIRFLSLLRQTDPQAGLCGYYSENHFTDLPGGEGNAVLSQKRLSKEKKLSKYQL